MDKKGFVGLIVVLGVLLVVGFFWFIGEKGFNEENVECVKVRTTCCPCNMGGKEKCVLASEVKEYEVNLSECPEDLVCLAVYSCEIESCGYIDGKCVAR
ncbi:hypothetical protein KAJ38_00215 [Candidatus Pacearchaeota archaeon]|nr:hypothetical protein [Candidatus Pacearchaeota archaeon]